MADKKLLTLEGKRKLDEELNDLKIVQRKEIAQKIKEAREQGDLSENAEYDAAKEEQRHIEGRIAELEAILKNVEVVDEDEIDADRANLGSAVTVENEQLGRRVFHLVGSTEASSLENRISNESPIGRALMGRKAGETVTAETPMGPIRLKILDIVRE